MNPQLRTLQQWRGVFWGVAALIGASFFLGAGSPESTQTAAPTVEATSVPSPTATPSEAAVKRLTPSEGRKLYQEFNRAQRTELQALNQRQKVEMQELRAAQKARQRQFEAQEKEARHKFFKEHTKGPERRAYVKDFLDRRKAMVAIMRDELDQRKREHEVRLRSMKDDQTQKRKEFDEFLKRGETPPERLWPGPGR